MFNKEDKLKWNDLSRSLQDIIMRRMTWKMLHPSLQKWLLHLEARATELERNLFYMWYGQQGQVAKVDIEGKYLYPSDNFLINGVAESADEKTKTNTGDSNLDVYRLDENKVYPAGGGTSHEIDDHEYRTLMYNPVLEHLYFYTEKNIYIKLFPYLDVLRLILYDLWADGKQGQVVKVDKTDNTLYPHNNFIDTEYVFDDYDSGTSTYSNSGAYNVKTTTSHKVVTDKLDTTSPSVKTTDRILMYNPKLEHLFWCLTNKKYEKLFPYLDVLRDEILKELWDGEEGQVPKIRLDDINYDYSKVHEQGVLYPHDNFVVTTSITKENFKTNLRSSISNNLLSSAGSTTDNTITNGGSGSNRILIYNSDQEQLFWYQKPNKYTRLFATLSDLGDSFKNIWNNGLVGQVIKINPDTDPGSLYPHDELMVCYVVDSEDYLNPEYINEDYKSTIRQTTNTFSNADIFRNWRRYTHFCNAVIKNIVDNSNYDDTGQTDGQNVLTNDEHKKFHSGNGWTYKPSDECIYDNYDSPVVAGFYKEGVATNYVFEMTVDTFGDNDNFFVVIGFMTDSSGIQHTLSVVRGNGNVTAKWLTLSEAWDSSANRFKDSRDFILQNHPNHKGDTLIWWALIYDFGNPTQLIVDFSGNFSSSPDTDGRIGPGTWPTNYSSIPGVLSAYPNIQEHNYCKIKVTRTGTSFNCSTTNWAFSLDGNNIIGDMQYQTVCDMNFTVNDAAGIADATARSNIQQMLSGTTGVLGVGVRSNRGRFKIDQGMETFFETEEEGTDINDGLIAYALHEARANGHGGEIIKYNSSRSDWDHVAYFDDPDSIYPERFKVSPRVLMYNNVLNRFYWYIQPGYNPHYYELFPKFWKTIENLLNTTGLYIGKIEEGWLYGDPVNQKYPKLYRTHTIEAKGLQSNTKAGINYSASMKFEYNIRCEFPKLLKRAYLFIPVGPVVQFYADTDAPNGMNFGISSLTYNTDIASKISNLGFIASYPGNKTECIAVNIRTDYLANTNADGAITDIKITQVDRNMSVTWKGHGYKNWIIYIFEVVFDYEVTGTTFHVSGTTGVVMKNYRGDFAKYPLSQSDLINDLMPEMGIGNSTFITKEDYYNLCEFHENISDSSLVQSYAETEVTKDIATLP